MTNGRKTQVNRLLAEFEGFRFSQGYCVSAVEGCEGFVGAKGGPSYTSDLNALARLESKLPQHGWIITHDKNGVLMVKATIYGEWFEPGKPDTEAEARAECIAQYLESKK